jgi:hypothetical protein
VKRLYGAVVHVDGEADMNRTLGIDQVIDNSFFDTVNPMQCLLELHLRIDKEIQVVNT